MADYVVSMGSEGRVLSHGSVLDAVQLDASLVKEIKEDASERIHEGAGSQERTSRLTDGGLIVAEEVEEGHVSWNAGKSPSGESFRVLITCFQRKCISLEWVEGTQFSSLLPVSPASAFVR